MIDRKRCVSYIYFCICILTALLIRRAKKVGSLRTCYTYLNLGLSPYISEPEWIFQSREACAHMWRHVSVHPYSLVFVAVFSNFLCTIDCVHQCVFTFMWGHTGGFFTLLINKRTYTESRLPDG